MGVRGQYGNFISNMGYGVGNSLYDIGSGIAGLGTPKTQANTSSFDIQYSPQGLPSLINRDKEVKLGTNLTGSYKWP